MIEKFTFELHSRKVSEKLILVKSDMEKRAHVVLKLLAYLLYYDPRLKVEAEVGMHYKPDLVIEGDHGVPELWIDCGKIAVRKVESLSSKLRNSRFVVVKETVSELKKFRQVIEHKLDHPERVEYLAFESSFVGGIADSLVKVNHFTLYDVMENTIGVAVNDEVFESVLYR